MPELGDLIEIFRMEVAGIPLIPLLDYQHWAVYVGDGYVVHLVNLGSDSFSSSSSSPSLSKPQTKSKGCKGKVKRQKLEVVADHCRWKVNNKLDNVRSPRPAQEIVEEALSLVGQDIFYDVTVRNCEHFATQLRYGISTSWQVLKYAAVGAAAVAGGVLGSIAGPGGMVGGGGALALWVKKKLE
ncbi:retinoic acid receptor responder protein 3-like [Seriola lalandi dorsalis]|uniref:Retinoic acid receptor responder protein 3-like n=1 Tax=Seriola lalandi dorsalis TaxID=1841481 RepID=A0A3B4XTB4_SERLL|nr:retinoic acid receptor responder protein 3-like [Seriola lalandi dorsalis]XP_023263080.1 retinoic acid receptor responder protein 3-like [Seriola lalandi dorsalis]